LTRDAPFKPGEQVLGEETVRSGRQHIRGLAATRGRQDRHPPASCQPLVVAIGQSCLDWWVRRGFGLTYASGVTAVEDDQHFASWDRFQGCHELSAGD